FRFPEITIEIQKTADYPGHRSYVEATERFQGPPSIGADGRLENYTAGRPFTHEQIISADPTTGGYMLAWTQIHRWQYYGYKVNELTMAYVGSSSGPAPLDPESGLDGGGSLDRNLTQSYHRVYLTRLAMLPEQGYRVDMRDSDTRFYKDYMEFLDPFNVKGTKFVIERMLDPHTDDQVNTYLPTERRVRRVSARERADSFMGSNGTLDDFEGFSGRVLDYKWTYLGQKQILYVADTKQQTLRTFGPFSHLPDDQWQLRNCHVVEARSVWEGHPYRSRVLFIDHQTFGVALSLVFNHDNLLWKTMQTVYQGPLPDDDDKASIETSVPRWRGQVLIDRLANTATVVSARTDTLFPTMSPSKIKSIFSVSSLTSGQ
ncbi:MAG: DUF1329 domain-containing protein, partial [Gammaproteobacteria bacterium]|nr:DUF1329 domain-containing protein [Gammaproteobacteria bacterium]